MASRSRALLISALVLVCPLVAPSAFARIDDVVVEPAAPVEGQPITIRVLGTLLDGCWDLQGSFCNAGPDSVPGACEERQLQPIEVQLLDTSDPDGEGCPQIELPYEVECIYASLPAGEYCAIVTERSTSERFPNLEPEVQYVAFVVQGVTPTEAVSWTMLKSTFRAR